jgi:hypothetical protein
MMMYKGIAHICHLLSASRFVHIARSDQLRHRPYAERIDLVKYETERAEKGIKYNIVQTSSSNDKLPKRPDTRLELMKKS